jgi:O-methyltransferase involved in polyketide biosynthesis
LTLGRYPALGVAAARAKAAEHRNALWRGEDPASARVVRVSAGSLDEVIDNYVAAQGVEARDGVNLPGRDQDLPGLGPRCEDPPRS